MRKLTIIGCGNVGKSLGRLWSQTGVFKICQILNQSPASSEAAIAWIGSGDTAPKISELKPADIFLISTPDDSLESTAKLLAESAALKPRSIVLHCSGALRSSVLDAVQDRGALTASVHPIKSFTTPCAHLSDFQGTFCGCEGQPEALEILEPAFRKIGATHFNIDPEQKSLYHAASVISSNYLTSLIEVSAQTYEKAGIPRELAMQIMLPMLQGTVQNNLKHGTANALTGPIARGDLNTVKTQLSAITDWNADYAEIYKLLGLVASQLATQNSNANHSNIAAIKTHLQEHSTH